MHMPKLIEIEKVLQLLSSEPLLFQNSLYRLKQTQKWHHMKVSPGRTTPLATLLQLG